MGTLLRVDHTSQHLPNTQSTEKDTSIRGQLPLCVPRLFPPRLDRLEEGRKEGRKKERERERKKRERVYEAGGGHHEHQLGTFLATGPS